MRKANQMEPDVPPGIHLNLGCGKKLWDGFINIDFPSNWSGKKADIECDVGWVVKKEGQLGSLDFEPVRVK